MPLNLFKKKGQSAESSAWWIKAQGLCQAMGHRINGWLQRRTTGIPPRNLKIICIVVLLVFMGRNSWIIIKAFQRRTSPPAVVPIRIPSHVLAPAVKKSGLYDSSTLNGINRKLDSLKTDSAGRIIYEKIVRERPGLLDSLRKLEKIYSR